MERPAFQHLDDAFDQFSRIPDQEVQDRIRKLKDTVFTLLGDFWDTLDPNPLDLGPDKTIVESSLIHRAMEELVLNVQIVLEGSRELRPYSHALWAGLCRDVVSLRFPFTVDDSETWREKRRSRLPSLQKVPEDPAVKAYYNAISHVWAQLAPKVHPTSVEVLNASLRGMDKEARARLRIGLKYLVFALVILERDPKVRRRSTLKKRIKNFIEKPQERSYYKEALAGFFPNANARVPSALATHLGKRSMPGDWQKKDWWEELQVLLDQFLVLIRLQKV